MNTIIHCPSCHQGLQLPGSLAGQEVQCPTCSKTFTADLGPQSKSFSSSPPVRGATKARPFDFDAEEIPAVELAEETNAKRPGGKYCIECGAIIRVRAAICPKCGVSQSDLEGRKRKHCYECGAVIRGKAAVCPKCGVAQFRQGDYADLDEDKEYKAAGSNRIAAGILAILLGCLGIHKFILGYTGAGVIMLLVSILGGCLYGAGPLVMAVIGIVEGILYLTKSDREFYRTYVLHKREWF